MLKILCGNEPYRIDKEIEECKKLIKEQSMNISYFNSLDNSVLTLCRTYPFLDEHRLIVVSVDSLTDDIIKFLDIPKFTMLFVLPEYVDKRTNAYKKLSERGDLLELNKLTEQQLRVFVVKYLKENGGMITERAYYHLVERAGYFDDNNVNLYTMEIYLKQLMLLGSVITDESVERIILPSCNENVYALSRALLSEDSEYTVKLSIKLLERGEQPIALLSLLLRMFRLGYKASLFDAEEQKEACALIGVSAYQLKGILCYSQEVLNRAIDIIQESIFDIKRGGGKNSFLLAISKLILTLHPRKISCCE